MSRSPRSGPQAPTSKTTRPGSFNHDFSQRVVLHTADLPWLASPMAGVERRMLAGAIARLAWEQARHPAALDANYVRQSDAEMAWTEK